MALTYDGTHRSGPGSPTRPATARHPVRPHLAEVVPIHPRSIAPDTGFGALISRFTQVVASLRTQAASGDSSPRPPSSPARLIHPAAPDDAA